MPGMATSAWKSRQRDAALAADLSSDSSLDIYARAPRDLPPWNLHIQLTWPYKEKFDRTHGNGVELVVSQRIRGQGPGKARRH